jgi:predicted phosphodiesterase
VDEAERADTAPRTDPDPDPRAVDEPATARSPDRPEGGVAPAIPDMPDQPTGTDGTDGTDGDGTGSDGEEDGTDADTDTEGAVRADGEIEVEVEGDEADEGADEASPARRLHSRLRQRPGWVRWGRRGRVAFFGLAGAMVGLALLGRVPAEVGPFDATVSARPSLTSRTTVRLAPLGTIVLDTHDWPMSLELRADQIGLQEAKQIANHPEAVDQLGDDVADDVHDALVRLAIRCTLVAVAGGLLGALAARASWRSGLAGASAGIVLVATVGGGTAATFDANAVAEPRYTGLLTAAPAAVGDVQSIIERFGEYRAQLSELVSNVVTLYLAAESLPTFAPDDDTIRVLHVSDIHLNPQAFDLMEQLIDQFGVDVVADTGDLTDWGTEPESRLVEEIGRLDVPYVWVRGNHDSRSTQRAVADQPNAVVLDGDAATVEGLRFWGIGDPRYTPNKDQNTDIEHEREVARANAPNVAAKLNGDELGADKPEVDVVLIHDARGAADLGGRVPLVLAGHAHKVRTARLGDDGETLVLTEGSTGGSGLRGLQGDEPHALAASVLYFDPDTKELLAYDEISVKGFGETGATIERHILGADDAEDEDDGDSGPDPADTGDPVLDSRPGTGLDTGRE